MNLFDISSEYLNIIAEIEDAEGVLTEELENRLKINEHEAEKKIKAYHHIITMAKADIAVITDEQDRLSKLKVIKNNLIERLKKYLLEATLLFGYEGKTGNKKLDYDTLKLYTQESESTEVDESVYIPNKFKLGEVLTRDEINSIILLLKRDVITIPVIIKDEIKEAITNNPIVLNTVSTNINPDYTNQFTTKITVSDVKGVKIVKHTGLRIK
jgi:hypothetical protein